MTQIPNRHAVILTALAVEYNAVRAHLNDVQKVTYNGSIYETGLFLSGDAQWKIGITQIGVGNATATFEAERAITYFNPEIVLFVGIAEGVKDVKIGDVIASTRVYGYESGAFFFKVFNARPDVGESSYALIQRARVEADKHTWQRRISIPGQTAATVYVGPIAAGEKVLDSSAAKIVSFLKRTYNDTLAVEMEGRGFLNAIHADQSVQALIIRGISNLLSQKSGRDKQTCQEMAADHASAFAFEMLSQLQQSAATPPIATLTSKIAEASTNLQLIDIYIHEDDKKPVLDITLYNTGDQLDAPTRANLEILDAGEFYYDDDNQARSFLMVSQNYDVTLSPVVQVQEVKIAHKILLLISA
jgi:nucleoside phosphorylase